MIQLAFEPAFDPFHAAFRVLRLARYKADVPTQLMRLKVLDLFLVEPRRCLEIRLSPPLKKAAKLAAINQSAIYGHRPSSYVLFNRMSPMQDAAIETLVSQGFLDGDAFSQLKVLLGETPIPSNLTARITDINSRQASLMKFLCSDLEEVPLDGPKGLKDRTGIGEYRYDDV